MGLWTRLRQNLSLKTVSLIAAVLLYIYVQQERNPTITRTLVVPVEYKNKQQGFEVFPDSPHVTVSVVGPRPVVERLKDGDIKASADIGSVTSGQSETPVRLVYEVPKSAPDVMLDSQPEFMKVQVFRQKMRKLQPQAIYKKDAPPGLKYGDPVIRPGIVTVRGREDRVNRVDKVVVNASPTEPKASIDGDFSLRAWDSDRNVVEGITIDPDTVHVTVPQLLEPSEGTVFVNPSYADRPAAGYEIVADITPNSVRVIGTPHRVSMIHAIYTEPLFVHDITSTTTIEASLITPPDVQIRDEQGRPISHVKVKLTISKAATPPGPDGNSPTPPKREGGGPP